MGCGAGGCGVVGGVGGAGGRRRCGGLLEQQGHRLGLFGDGQRVVACQHERSDEQQRMQRDRAR